MIKPEQVPKEVIVELLAALNSCDCDDCTSVAIAAAINAWPGIIRIQETNGLHQECWLQLPLQREGGDE